MRHVRSTLAVAGVGLLLAGGCSSQQQQAQSRTNMAEPAAYQTSPDPAYSEQPIHNPYWQYEYGSGFVPERGTSQGNTQHY